MKRILLVTILSLSTGLLASAQQAASDVPATKEDVQKYLEVMHSREMMTKMMDAMLKPMHQMWHERYLKDKDILPPDFEQRMAKEMDMFMKSLPWDDLLSPMVPVYQKHFTKGDMDNLVAFYATPTGQKFLKESPAIMAEYMESAMPLMQKHVESMKEGMEQEVAQMIKDSKGPNGSKSQAKPN